MRKILRFQGQSQAFDLESRSYGNRETPIGFALVDLSDLMNHLKPAEHVCPFGTRHFRRMLAGSNAGLQSATALW